MVSSRLKEGNKASLKQDKVKEGWGWWSNSSSNFTLGCHSNEFSLQGAGISIRRRPISSRCSKRWWEDHSIKAGQQERERERERGASLSRNTWDVQDDMSAILQVIPLFVSLHFSPFVERHLSVAPGTNPDKAQSLTLYNLPHRPH